MKLSCALAAMMVLLLTAAAHAGEARPMNSAEDVALWERLAAEADAKRGASHMPASRSSRCVVPRTVSDDHLEAIAAELRRSGVCPFVIRIGD